MTKRFSRCSQIVAHCTIVFNSALRSVCRITLAAAYRLSYKTGLEELPWITAATVELLLDSSSLLLMVIAGGIQKGSHIKPLQQTQHSYGTRG